jgi:hypothetical protein
MESSQGVWIGFDAAQKVHEVSIVLHQGGSPQPVPRTPAMQSAAQNLALLALYLSGVPDGLIGRTEGS